MCTLTDAYFNPAMRDIATPLYELHVLFCLFRNMQDPRLVRAGS